MKKRIGIVIVGILCIGLVVGAYYYVSHRNTSDQTDVSEVQKVILRDLDGSSYPAAPREVIKFYNRILSCYYNEEYTEDEFYQLADQARALMDQELADNNPAEQYYLKVQGDVNSYHEKNKKINNTSVCDSNDVKYATIDGAECAYLTSSYFIRGDDGFTKSIQNYVLRKDSEGKWKILAFELAEGGNEEDE